MVEYYTTIKGDRRSKKMAQWVKYLPHKDEDLRSSLWNLNKARHGVHLYKKMGKQNENILKEN